MAKMPKRHVVVIGARSPLIRSFSKSIIWAGSVAGGILALLALWTSLGLPTPAWSSDIKALNRNQTETAIDVYQRAVRGQLSAPAPIDPVAKQNWDEELRQNRIKLDEAVKRRLELSK